MSNTGNGGTPVIPPAGPPELDWSKIRLPGLDGNTVALVSGGARRGWLAGH